MLRIQPKPILLLSQILKIDKLIPNGTITNTFLPEPDPWPGGEKPNRNHMEKFAMKTAFSSVFAYLGIRSTVVVGHVHAGFVGSGQTLIDYSERLPVKMANVPKKRQIDHHGQIDITKIYGGYYAESVAMAAFCPQKITIRSDVLEKPIDTYIARVSTIDAEGDLDALHGEVAVIMVGENAKQLYRQLNLEAKRLRPFETAGQGRGYIKRRLRYFGLVEKQSDPDDVASIQPPREVVNQQMYASEPGRLPDNPSPV